MNQFIRINATRVLNSARILDFAVGRTSEATDTADTHGPGGDYSIFVNVEPLAGALKPISLSVVDKMTEELAHAALQAIEAHLNGPMKNVSLPVFLGAMHFDVAADKAPVKA